MLHDYILFYYTMFECCKEYDILSIYYIGLYQNTPSSIILSCLMIMLFMFIYRQKSWVVLSVKYLSRLIFGRVMVNSLMKDQEGQS